MRRIDEAIESLTPAAPTGDRPGAPMAFRWRGRRYVVDSVLAHWVETGAWWRQGDRLDRLERFGSEAVEPTPPADPERWIWRVEVAVAGTGRRSAGQTGVFDLCWESDPGGAEPTPERWSVHAIHD